MRRAVVVLFLVACGSTSEEAREPGAGPAPGTTTPAPAPTTPAPTPAPSPTPSDGTTTFRIHYTGQAGTLSLRGSSGPLSWEKSVPLTQGTDATVFVYQTKDITAPTEWKPMLGETWSRGPNYRVARGQTVDVYPHFVVAAGRVEKLYPAFVSQKLPSTRNVWAYLPPTYLENTAARLPVIYMHDAQNLFDAASAFGGNEWKVDETMNAGAEDGTIRETIVIGIDNTPDRIGELTPTSDPQYGGGKADAYLAMIADEVKPKVDKDLRTLPGRADTAIMGSSLGGLVSVYAGVERADVFGVVAAMSPSTWWDNRYIVGHVGTLATHASKPIRVYVDSGDAGASNDDVANTKTLADAIAAQGYTTGKDLRYVVAKGAAHNETYWAARLPAALPFVLGAGR